MFPRQDGRGRGFMVAKDAGRAVLAVFGMRNNSCRESVAEALGRVEGATDVSVSLIRARAIVMYVPPCDTAALIRAVEGAGYGAMMDGRHGGR